MPPPLPFKRTEKFYFFPFIQKGQETKHQCDFTLNREGLQTLLGPPQSPTAPTPHWDTQTTPHLSRVPEGRPELWVSPRREGCLPGEAPEPHREGSGLAPHAVSEHQKRPGAWGTQRGKRMRFNYRSHQAPLGTEAPQPGPRVTFQEVSSRLSLADSCQHYWSRKALLAWPGPRV